MEKKPKFYVFCSFNNFYQKTIALCMHAYYVVGQFVCDKPDYII